MRRRRLNPRQQWWVVWWGGGIMVCTFLVLRIGPVRAALPPPLREAIWIATLVAVGLAIGVIVLLWFPKHPGDDDPQE